MTTHQKALADAHTTIRELRNLLAVAAEPLRLRIRELESKLAEVEKRASKQNLDLLILAEQNAIRERLIEALLEYRRLSPLASGKEG